MDYVLTTSKSWISKLIKWRTAGYRQRNNPYIASHAGILVRHKNQWHIAEMLRKFTLTPISAYSGDDFWKNHIVCIRRNPIYEMAGIRVRAHAEVIKDALTGKIRYDYVELLRFICPGLPEDSHRYYCSERLQYYAMKHGNPIETKLVGDNITPHGIQIAKNLKTVAI